MSTRSLLLVYFGLLVLLAANIAVAVQFPQWALLALGGAAMQAALVMAGFIQLGTHSALVRFFALGAGFWLLLLFSLTLADLLTR